MTEWKIIEGFENYEISRCGVIRVFCPHSHRTFKGRVLKQKAGGGRGQYLRVNLTTPNGKKVDRYIHRLVAQTFLQKKKDNDTQVAHNDGNPHNNHFSNLRWTDNKGNQLDRFLHGTDSSGEKNARAALTNLQAQTIIYEWLKTLNTSDLAEKYSVCRATISAIIIGRTYKCLKRPTYIKQLVKLNTHKRRISINEYESCIQKIRGY